MEREVHRRQKREIGDDKIKIIPFVINFGFDFISVNRYSEVQERATLGTTVCFIKFEFQWIDVINIF